MLRRALPLTALAVAVSTAAAVTPAGAAGSAVPFRGHFLYVDGGGNGNNEIFAVDTAGQRTYDTGLQGISVSYSPDGRSAAFTTVSQRSDGSETTVVSVRDRHGKLRQLSPPGEDAADPAWSPDGNAIAYVAGDDGLIQLVHPDGSGLRTLTRTRDSNHPSWSPDSRHLAYFTFDGNIHHLTRVYDIDIRTGKPRQLAASILSRAPQLNLDRRTSWLPDGKDIAFDAAGSKNSSGIAVVSPDGSGYRLLDKRTDGFDALPVWVPEIGIAFDHVTRGADGAPVYTVDLASGNGRITRLFTHSGGVSFGLLGYIPR